MSSANLSLLRVAALALTTSTLAACGVPSRPRPQRSGVQGAALVRSLDDAARRTLCEWSTRVQGGEGHATSCGAGMTARVGSVDDCVAHVADVPQDCALTVSQSEDCTLAAVDDPCGGAEDPRCAPALACGGNSRPAGALQ